LLLTLAVYTELARPEFACYLLYAMVRLGLIGLGWHGMRYARHIVRGEVSGAELSAIWRRDQHAGRVNAEELGVPFEPDLGKLIESSKVDAVIAVVPTSLNLSVAQAVAKAGKPLLLEKPIARTISEASRICDAFREAKTTLMVAQTLRFDPLVLELRRKLEMLGGLRGFSFEQRIEPRGLAWEDDPVVSGGGVLMQTAIHTLDAIRFITSSDRIRVLGAETARMQYERNEDHAITLLEIGMPGGARVIGQVAASKIGRSRHVRFNLYLEQVGLTADLVRRRLIETRDREETITGFPDAPTVALAATAFIRTLRGEAPNPVSGEDAMRSLALVEAAYARAGGSL
jgi:predicted dehydrogenase